MNINSIPRNYSMINNNNRPSSQTSFSGIYNRKKDVINTVFIQKPLKMEYGQNYIVSSNAKFVVDSAVVDLSTPDGKRIIDDLKPNQNISYVDYNQNKKKLELTKIDRNKLFAVNTDKNVNIQILPSLKMKYVYDFTQLNSHKILPKGTPSIIPLNGQLVVDGDYTFDFRNKNIQDVLDEYGCITIGTDKYADIPINKAKFKPDYTLFIQACQNNKVLAADIGYGYNTQYLPVNIQKPFYHGVSNIKFRQQNIGDCYVLAPLYALSTTPGGGKILEKMVKMNNDGSYTVKFKNKKPITIKPDELDGQKNFFDDMKNSVQGDPGIKAIERAYAKMVKSILPGYTMYSEIDKGGLPNTALKKMTGLESSIYCTDEDNIPELFSQISRNGCKNYVMTCSTPYSLKHKYRNRYTPHHAYAIKNIDEKRQTVDVVNPHDTSYFQRIGWSEFQDVFEHICVAPLHKFLFNI
ncbi:MAG: C2 family cysteine protease [Candidatus Gastranaerophilales bacterium]|nr:C2 family cysteine protease [Candidatus Gastranaerophilales bacterium]